MATDFSELEEKRQLIRLLRMNEELDEVLCSHLSFLIRDCKERGIVLPHLDRTIELMKRAQNLIRSMPRLSPDLKRGFFSPEDDNGTMPD